VAARRRLAQAATAAADRLPGLRAAVSDRLPQLSVTLVAGLLLCASFPPLNWWWAAVFAFALLAGVLTRPSTTPVGGFGYGFLFGLAFYLLLLPWISGLVGALPWLVLTAVCAVFPAVFGLLAVLVRELPGWPIWFAALFAAQEWAKSTLPFGGFPWGVVGFGQTSGPLLPLVALGGVPLLSAAIALSGCAATAIGIQIVLWLHRDHPTGSDGADSPGPPPAVLLPGICICLVLLTTAMVWPGVRRSGAGSGDEPAVTVAVVQGNVPRLGLDFNAQRREVLDFHVRETRQLADDVHAGRAPQPQFVVWPENSSDIDPLVNADAEAQIAEAAQAIGAPILVGTVRDGPGWVREDPVSMNSVLVWDPVAGPGDRHDKRIVQPFGEYLPWRGFFRHLSGYADRAGYFVPGEGTGVVHAAGVPVGVATCWEVIFDRAPRESVLGGAQLLAVPTNNATFDQAMSEQQLAFAKARAVEHDRYVVVAGTTGISAVIAPDGRELARTNFFEPAYLDTVVRLKTTLTPATRWGPLLRWLLVGAGVVSVLAAILQNGWFMHRRSSRPVRTATMQWGYHPLAGDEAMWRSGAQEPRPGDDETLPGPGPAEQRRLTRAGDDAERSDEEKRRLATGERPSQHTLVLIPTFNELENLPLVVHRLRRARPDAHVLVIDDDSPDGTGKRADELASADPDRVHVMHRTAKAGLGAAYLAGFAWGLSRQYAVLVEMDADGSHAPEQLHRLLDAVDAGADLAIGSRYVDGGAVRNWPWRRLALSKTANTYSRLFLGVGIRDVTAGYRAYRREVLEKIDLAAVDSKGYCFQIDLTWRTVNNGFTVVEVPITFTERELGVSKMSGSNIREALVKVARWGIGGRLSRGRGVRA
jgi:apolipoprotein N-acyltransferase